MLDMAAGDGYIIIYKVASRFHPTQIPSMNENPYQSPEPVPPDNEQKSPREVYSQLMRQIRRVFIAQFFGGLLTALILDGGGMFRLFCISALAYWVFALIFMIFYRPHRTPGAVSMFLLRHGTLTVFLVLLFFPAAAAAISAWLPGS